MARSNHWVSPERWNIEEGACSHEAVFPEGLIPGRREFRRRYSPRKGCSTRGFESRHPSWQAKLWRQEYRTKINRSLRRDPEGFQPFPINKVTEAYDWY